MTAALHPPTLSLPPPQFCTTTTPNLHPQDAWVLPTCLAGDVGMGEDPGGCLCARQTLKVGVCPPSPSPQDISGTQRRPKGCSRMGCTCPKHCPGLCSAGRSWLSPVHCSQHRMHPGRMGARSPEAARGRVGGSWKGWGACSVPLQILGLAGGPENWGGRVEKDPTPPVPAETHQEHSVCH